MKTILNLFKKKCLCIECGKRAILVNKSKLNKIRLMSLFEKRDNMFFCLKGDIVFSTGIVREQD